MKNLGNLPSPTKLFPIPLWFFMALSELHVTRCLGVGASASVYEGVVPGSDDKYAVKVFSSRSPMYREQSAFLAIQDAPSSSPFIVRMHGVTSNEEALMLELCTGGDLFTELDKCGGDYLEERRGRHLAQQIADALCFCHARHVYHMDVKPDNVFVSGGGDVRLGDFSRAVVGAQKKWTAEAYGTLEYSAPETLREARPYDASKADVWALGVTLASLLMGYFPWETAEDANPSFTAWRALYDGDRLPTITEAREVLPTKYLAERPPVSDACIQALIKMLHPNACRRPCMRFVRRELSFFAEDS